MYKPDLFILTREGWTPEPGPRFRPRMAQPGFTLPHPLPEIQPAPVPPGTSLTFKETGSQTEAGFHANNLLNGGLYTGKPYCGN